MTRAGADHGMGRAGADDGMGRAGADDGMGRSFSASQLAFFDALSFS